MLRFIEQQRLYSIWTSSSSSSSSSKSSISYKSSYSRRGFFQTYLQSLLLFITLCLVLADFLFHSPILIVSQTTSSSSSSTTTSSTTSTSFTSSNQKLPRTLFPTKSSCLNDNYLPETSVHAVALGFTCFDNLYLYQGRPHVYLKIDGTNSIDISLADFVKSSEFMFREGLISELTSENVATMTRDGPIPTLYSAQILIDDSNRPSLTNFKYFTEGLASSIFLEAFTHLPPAEAVICLYCDKNVNKKDSINEILTSALFNNAPLLRGEDFNETTTTTTTTIESLTKWNSKEWCSTKPTSPLPMGKVPLQSLHIARACMSDRKTSHKSKLSFEQNNINAQLVLIITSSLQRDMDIILKRLQTSSLLQKNDMISSTLKDTLGISIKDILDIPSSIENPLILILKHVTFNEDSYDTIVQLAYTYSTRILLVSLDLLTLTQQLYLLTKVDILISPHSIELSHLLWTKRGSGVLEIFPHWSSTDSSGIKEGSSWSNDFNFLTQLKGNIYRAIDSKLGSQIPINHPILDMPHQLIVENIKLNTTAVEKELDSLVMKWKWIKSEEKLGKVVDMTRHWHPEWKERMFLQGMIL
jgi:hypothetical protein